MFNLRKFETPHSTKRHCSVSALEVGWYIIRKPLRSKQYSKQLRFSDALPAFADYHVVILASGFPNATNCSHQKFRTNCSVILVVFRTKSSDQPRVDASYAVPSELVQPVCHGMKLV